MIVVAILRGAGFGTVLEANDGASAFEVIRMSLVDIVIADLNMKPIDGLEFVQMIRKMPNSPNPYVPIIMMTGHTERSKVVAARDIGINEFVAKPISAKTLLQRIIAVIDRPRSFVKSIRYRGPCRRRGHSEEFFGPWQRKSDVQA
jgi:two-component system, chemotaxis family, chemotaxis protein CheY